MRLRRSCLAILPLILASSPASAATTSPDLATTGQVYQTHCASCHGTQRLGGTGPALLPESLSRLRAAEAREVILHGRPASQMTGFATILSPQDIDRLVEYLYKPTATPPRWTDADIRASQRQITDPATLSDTPRHHANPNNLFVVVQAGDHTVDILDGDRFESLAHFPSHFALHGGPKFSPDGRYVYFASRDGWISKYDLHNLVMVSEIRAGLNTRNLAVSNDGRWVLVGNTLPAGLVVLDARDLSLVQRIDTATEAHPDPSRVSAVYTAPPRDSFIVALKDIPEVWEIAYDVASPPFKPRRLAVDSLLDDFSFSPDYRQLIASSRQAKGMEVIDLDTGALIKHIALPGMPHLGSGIFWKRHGRLVFATPNISTGLVSVLDAQTWEPIQEIQTLGPGFFMRSHVNSPYAWTDVFFGPNIEAVHVIDKQSLEIARTLRPMPGKNAAHVEFTHDGRYLLLSVWDPEGALIVYDSKTLQEIKRIPMNKPSGKYNVGNKIEFAEGTSH
ncbi:MAG: cytochrome D1 domain-containing protein [Castellaniella sp.]|uniref:cytochrome D1 domain-containing protein n=1 Tax=Castellaniella sp. TaxID=1955812 RepID=UPI002A35AC0D|nr:cytochrome D1 domain-containing protein [Castellaniella sp.]MDY0310244.1 cytochrome D1 domain-containing protein [Castellaniella sp.]